MAPPKVWTGNANGNRKDNQGEESASVSAVTFARGVDRSQEGETAVIAEKRRTGDKLAEMRSRVVVQQEMMAAKTMEERWEVERRAAEVDRDVMLRQLEGW
jgi:hypothetical protein